MEVVDELDELDELESVHRLVDCRADWTLTARVDYARIDDEDIVDVWRAKVVSHDHLSRRPSELHHGLNVLDGFSEICLSRFLDIVRSAVDD